MLESYKGDQAVGVSVQFQKIEGGEQRVAIVSLLLSSPGLPWSPQRMNSLQVIFQLSRMGWDLPLSVLKYLCTPALSLVTFEWEAGGSQSLKYVLQQQCGCHGLLEAFNKQRHFDFTQQMKDTMWTTVLCGPLFVEPSCSRDTSWMVGVVGFEWLIF